MKRKTRMLALVSGLMAAAVMFIGCTIDALDNPTSANLPSVPPVTTTPEPEYGVIKDANAHDLSEKFGVTSTGTTKVTDTLAQVHAYLIENPDAPDIEPGNYIELPGLTVQPDTNNEGAINGLTKVHVLVVGKNSFNGKNGNNTPHLVFQFKDALVERVMDVPSTPYKYTTSGMQKYLQTEFVEGLVSAGVSETYLWAPKRAMAQKYNSSNPTTEIDIITDTVWLPTVWEVFGGQENSPIAEGSTNQAVLAYYNTGDGTVKKARRTKTLSGGASTSWWLASPNDDEPVGVYAFAVSAGGGADRAVAYSGDGFDDLLGFSPAFCIN